MDDSFSTFMSKRHNYETAAMNPGTIVSRAQLAPQVLLWADSLRDFPAEKSSNGNLKKSRKRSVETLNKSEQNVRKVDGLHHSLCTEEEEEEETSSSEEEELPQYSADRRRAGSKAQEEIQQARKLLKILNLEHMISEQDVVEHQRDDDLIVGRRAYSSFQLKSQRQKICGNDSNSVASKKTRLSAGAYHPMSKKFDLDRDICASDIDEMEKHEEGDRAADSKEDIDASMQLWTAPLQTNKAGLANTPQESVNASRIPSLLPDSTSDQQLELEKDQTRRDVTISQWRYKPLAATTTTFTSKVQKQLMTGLDHFRSQQQLHNNQLLDIIKTDTTTCEAFQQDKALLIQQDQGQYNDSSACTPILSYSSFSNKNLIANKMESSESAHHHAVLQVEIQKLRDSLEQQSRQIGILTKSNSKLLLRTETLEKEIKLLTSIQFISSTFSSS